MLVRDESEAYVNRRSCHRESEHLLRSIHRSRQRLVI